MVRVLDEAAVGELLELEAMLDVVEAAFLAQGRGAVERPERPHFPVGIGLDTDDASRPLGTGLVMPAYVHGADHYATKLVSVHEGNDGRELPTVQAQIALTEAATGRPAGYLAGTAVTNARTGCIGGVAVRALRSGRVALGLLGAGTQARWQARAIDAAVGIEAIRIYSPSESKNACAADLEATLAVDAEAVDSPRAAVEGADVVVTATTATEPVFPGEALSPHTVVVAIGAYTADMRELDGTTMARAELIYADVPEEAAAVGDVAEAGLTRDDLLPLATLLSGRDQPGVDASVVIESVGSAVLDAAAAEHLLELAIEKGIGVDVEF